ncbi:HAD hydrolase-like protein [Arthrobacter sp. 35W]|uniref:HAD hydrolase-like protein n=1 Tax=Arthrobacter sp. 35W TaxID=1132441 RepID=UPI00041D5DD8|nr:HAD hydrolase-like protein [Arthrobacter sp. 35W]
MTIAAPAVLFDLDGTLVDPAGGITSGVAHALRALGLAVPSDAVLESMIGPKLSDSLAVMTEAADHQIPELIAIYRRWYAEKGIAMSRVYPGVAELLATLKAAGVPLGVATQKPQGLARTVLEHHGLHVHFTAIAGSSDDETLMPGDPGYRSGKTEIIASALSALGVEPNGEGAPAAVMVGDRHQDVRGATANNLPCIGVDWGFAAPGELGAAGAIAVVGTAAELLAQLSLPATPKESAHGAL